MFGSISQRDIMLKAAMVAAFIFVIPMVRFSNQIIEDLKKLAA